MRWIITCLLVMAILAPGALVAKDPSSARKEDANIEVRPVRPPDPGRPGSRGSIDVDVWTNRRTYSSGQPVQIRVRTDEDAYLFVYSTDGDGVTHQLLPNYYERDNFVRAHRTFEMPSRRYELIATGEGRDTIHVIAVERPEKNWKLPPHFRTYSEKEPFHVWKGGVEEARSQLRQSLEKESGKKEQTESDQDFTEGTGKEKDLGSIKHQDSKGRVIVAPPGGPAWGEAWTSIYVSPRRAPRDFWPRDWRGFPFEDDLYEFEDGHQEYRYYEYRGRVEETDRNSPREMQKELLENIRLQREEMREDMRENLERQREEVYENFRE